MVDEVLTGEITGENPFCFDVYDKMPLRRGSAMIGWQKITLCFSLLVIAVRCAQAPSPAPVTARLDDITASPMTYAVNSKQYVAIAAGSNIFSFALP